MAKLIRGYTGRDTQMRALVHGLEAEASIVAVPMAEPSLKEMHFRSYASAKTRNLDGTAFRRTS